MTLPRTRFRRHDRPSRAGAVLLEVIVSMAIFVAAASFTLRATGSVLSALDQSRREQAAVDLAVSTMAELEAGIIDLRSLRSGRTMDIRGPTWESERLDDGPWRLEIDTARSEHRGLTLVELTVVEDLPQGDDRVSVQYSIRRLMSIADGGESTYEDDELLDGLPADNAEDSFDDGFDDRFEPNFGGPSWEEDSP